MLIHREVSAFAMTIMKAIPTRAVPQSYPSPVFMAHKMAQLAAANPNGPEIIAIFQTTYLLAATPQNLIHHMIQIQYMLRV